MINHFSVNMLTEVDIKLRNLAKKRDLEDQAAGAEQEIIQTLGLGSVHLAEQLLDQLDRSAVEAEIPELTGRFVDQDGRSRELFSEHSKASDRLDAVGGDDAVAMIEQRRRTILIGIEEGARRYLRRRLGVAAAEHALRIYRDQHRSRMMARASHAFKTVSRGTYRQLATQPSKDGEVLVAVSNGGSKSASELSRGRVHNCIWRSELLGTRNSPHLSGRCPSSPMTSLRRLTISVLKRHSNYFPTWRE